MRRTWVQLDVPRDETSCRGCGWRLVDCQDGEPGEVGLRCCEVCNHPTPGEPPVSTEGMSFAESVGWKAGVVAPQPNGCAACGVDQQNHGQRWHPDMDWHGWLEPSNEQRLARLRARREARHA